MNQPNYMRSMSLELSSADRQQEVRQLAGLNLKNALYAKEAASLAGKQEMWRQLPGDVRVEVLEMVLRSLSEQSRQVSSSAAQVVSSMVAAGLKAQQCTDVIPRLVAQVTQAGSPVALRVSSLEALGYICEEVDEELMQEADGQPPTRRSDKVLTAIVFGMRAEEQNMDVRLAAVKAMLNALDFAGSNFAREAERSAIMNAICLTAAASDVRVRAIAFECLVKVGSNFYPYVGQYMQTIFNLTLEAMRKDESDVALLAIEYWSSLCDVEIDILIDMEDSKGEVPSERKCQRFIAEALKFLCPVLMELLTKQEEDQDEDTWNVATAAGTCLNLVAQTVQDAVVPEVVPFVQRNIQSQNWREREAALLAFGSILEGPSPQSMVGLVADAMGVILHHTRDGESIVRDTAAWTVARVCLLHHETAIGSDGSRLPQIMEICLTGLYKDTPLVASRYCFALNSLCENLQMDAVGSTDLPRTGPLSMYFDNIAKALLHAAVRDDADMGNLRASAYNALHSLIQFACEDSVPSVRQLLDELLRRFEHSFEASIMSAEDKRVLMELQGNLADATMACAQKLGSQLEKEVALTDRMMTLYLRALQAGGSTINEAVLMATGTLATAVGRSFLKYADHAINFLLEALKRPYETSTCSTAVGVVSDYAVALGADITKYCNHIINQLAAILQDPNVDRAIKPAVFSSIGDIALNIGGEFACYIGVLPFFVQAGKQTVPEDADYDIVDLIVHLREELLEAYTGVLQGLKTDHKVMYILELVPPILEFIHLVWTDRANRNEDLARACVELIGDLADALGESAKQMLTHTFIIQELIPEAEQMDSPELQRQLVWTKSKLMALASK